MLISLRDTFWYQHQLGVTVTDMSSPPIGLHHIQKSLQLLSSRLYFTEICNQEN